MTLRFDGQAALITGSSTGTGLEYARLLAARGAKIILNGRHPETLADVAKEIRDAGGTVAVAAGDLSTEQGCNDVTARALDAFGGLDILVNNAGFSRRVPVDKIALEDFEMFMAMNLTSTVLMVRNLWPHMKAKGYGRIVNTGSGSAMMGIENSSQYAASKGGIFGFMRSLVLETVSIGIKINTVTPTAATRLAKNIQDEDFKKIYFENMAADRCAPIVCWLAHESCSVNGEIFNIGGGIVSRYVVGVTPGYLNPSMTIEDVAANIDTIMEPKGYTEPRHAEKNAMEMIKRIRAWSSKPSSPAK